MASIEISEIEFQLEHRLLYNVRLNGDAGRFDLPIGILDRGSDAANETAVLTAAVGVAEQLGKAARDRLALKPAG